MTSIDLQIGLKALLSSQAGLDTVGHNISNAATPGYSRQTLHLSTSAAQVLRGLSIGTGVDADMILRTADQLLHQRIVAQNGSIAQLDTRLAGMSQVEALFGEPSDNGLQSKMQALFASFSSLASDPGDSVLRTSVVESSAGLATRFQELAQNLATTKHDTAMQVGGEITKANDLAQHLVALNRDISSFEATGAPANDLRDQRDEALKSLGAQLDISYHEGSNGVITVTSGGALLVGSNHAYALSSQVAPDGKVTIALEGHEGALAVKGGAIGGLVQTSQSFVRGLSDKLNALAHNMILELDRAHSTGMPSSGSFQKLTGANAVQDQNGYGTLDDELLARAGLPFDVRKGSLYVNTIDRTSGALSTTRIDIDPATTTVGDLIDALNAIPHVGASLDSGGRLQIEAAQGFGFDFSRRINAAPDVQGTFGGKAASLGAANAGPYALADGDTLAIAGPSGSIAITLHNSNFQDISAATSDELAAAINADPSTAIGGMRALSIGGRVVLQSLAQGSSTSFTLTGGSALGALGWSAGTSVSGQNDSVDVKVTGSFDGKSNELYSFVANNDGTVGATSGLKVDVFNAHGDKLTTLDVGAGYTPGTPLALGNGLSVSFGLGQLSATDHDACALHALADSDTSDALVALGVNSLFTGKDASDIALNKDIAADPTQLATSSSGASGDNTAIKDLSKAQDASVQGLGGATLGSFYGDVVGGIGFAIDSAQSAHDVESFLMDSLTQRREATSGVNVDEELTHMIQFQQSFGAAAQYIQVVNTTNNELLHLI